VHSFAPSARRDIGLSTYSYLLMHLMDFDEIHCKNYGINIILVYELVLYMKAVLYFISVRAIFFRICCTKKVT